MDFANMTVKYGSSKHKHFYQAITIFVVIIIITALQAEFETPGGMCLLAQDRKPG